MTYLLDANTCIGWLRQNQPQIVARIQAHAQTDIVLCSVVVPEGNMCGWYLWAGGEPSTADDFFQPMCVEHLADHCPAAITFLALPPGWRFLTDGEYVDVWYDSTLIEGRRRTSR